MNIYRSRGEPKKIKTALKRLEYENWDKYWEYLGELPSRVGVLRNETNEDLTKEEMEKHLYLTEELLVLSKAFNLIQICRKIFYSEMKSFVVEPIRVWLCFSFQPIREFS